jgi:hypothetical protein
MAKAAKRPSRKRGRQIRRRRKAGVEPSPPPIDPENPSRLPIDPETGLIDWDKVAAKGPQPVPDEWIRSAPTDEEWWATYGRGTFKNTAEYIEAGNRLDYYLAIRDGRIKPRYDGKGRLLVPWEQKSELKPQSKAESQLQPGPEDEPGPQVVRALVSLKEANPGGIPDGKSVNQLRTKALPYLPPDPDKGFPQWDAYNTAIKRLRHSGFRKPEK